MKIKDIKNDKLRELALKRCDNDRGLEDSVILAFDPNITEEGEDFWFDVHYGLITKLPRKKRDVADIIAMCILVAAVVGSVIYGIFAYGIY